MPRPQKIIISRKYSALVDPRQYHWTIKARISIKKTNLKLHLLVKAIRLYSKQVEAHRHLATHQHLIDSKTSIPSFITSNHLHRTNKRHPRLAIKSLLKSMEASHQSISIHTSREVLVRQTLQLIQNQISVAILRRVIKLPQSRQLNSLRHTKIQEDLRIRIRSLWITLWPSWVIRWLRIVFLRSMAAQLRVVAASNQKSRRAHLETSDSVNSKKCLNCSPALLITNTRCRMVIKITSKIKFSNVKYAVRLVRLNLTKSKISRKRPSQGLQI